MQRITIIGGGISGLTAAYDLVQFGFDCSLIEEKTHLGGVIKTVRVKDCILEDGPDSFLAQKPWALDLIRELGIEDQVIGSNDHLRRTFILRAGRMIPLPDGIHFMIPTKIWPVLTTRLVGWKTKAKMMQEWFRQPTTARANEERSVATFMQDHFGKEANHYLAQPMLAGVYGGSPERLSVDAVLPRFVELEKQYGSVSRGILQTDASLKKGSLHRKSSQPLFFSLKNGMQQLTDHISKRLSGRIRRITGSAKTLKKDRDGFHIVVEGQKISSDQVIIATPAHAASNLLQNLDPETSDHLKAIPYSSSMTVNLLYRRPNFGHALQGFGFLAPEVEQTLIAACTWVNTKFQHRATDDYIILRAFVSHRQTKYVSSMPDEDIANQVHNELSQIMGFTAKPTAWRIARWNRAMAQYEIGHRRRVDKIEARLNRVEGLHLTGNAYEGIGIPDCIHRSRKIAHRIQENLAAV